MEVMQAQASFSGRAPPECSSTCRRVRNEHECLPPVSRTVQLSLWQQAMTRRSASACDCHEPQQGHYTEPRPSKKWQASWSSLHCPSCQCKHWLTATLARICGCDQISKSLCAVTELYTMATAFLGCGQLEPRLRYNSVQANVDNNKTRYEEEQKEKVRQCEQARDRRYPPPLMLLPAHMRGQA